MNRKAISAVAVLALGATLAFAAPHDGKDGQWEGHHGKRHHGMFGEKMAAKLNLTDAQKQQIKDMNKSFREANKTFFQSAHETHAAFHAAKEANDTAKLDSLKATMASQRAQMKQLHETQMAQVRTVLTPAQAAQLDALKAERQARHAQHKEQQ